MTITLTVNGDLYVHDGTGTLDSLIYKECSDIERVAVMINDKVVDRCKWSNILLADEDRVEILTMAGGG